MPNSAPGTTPLGSREYSVVYNNGHRVMLRDREDAEQMSKLTRGRVEWRMVWQPFEAHPAMSGPGTREEWERQYDEAVQWRDWQTCEILLDERKASDWYVPEESDDA